MQPYIIPVTFQDNKKQGYLEVLPGILKQFSAFLGERKWFAGDKVNILIERNMLTTQNVPHTPALHRLFN